MTETPPKTVSTSASNRRRCFQALGVALLALAAVIAMLGSLWFFAYAFYPAGELLGESASPRGEWAYRLSSVDLGGALGSPAYQVRVYPLEDPRAERILYIGPEPPPQLEWVGETTLVVDGRTVDVRVATPGDFDSPLERRLGLIFGALFVGVPTVVVAGAGVLVLVRARGATSRARRAAP